MAELTVIEGSAPEVIGQVLLIPADQVDMGERLRPIDQEWAQALASIFKVEGQRTPIEVCRLPGRKRWRLIFGGHRLAACLINGEPVKAIVGSADAMDRRQAEISENVFRRGLDPLDRAAFVAELYELQKARAGVAEDASPQGIAANAKWLKERAEDASAKIAHAYGFADDVAAKVGLSRRSIYNDLALHKGLRPDVVAKLRGLPIASNAGQLQALAKLSDADQRASVDLITGRRAKSVSDAIAILRQKPQASPETKAWSAFFGGWSRMSARRRREALRELADQGLPTGVRLVFDGDGE